MSLDALTRLDPMEAQRVLAAASFSLSGLPSPLPDETDLREPVQNVVSELRRRLHLTDDDLSQEALVQLNDALSEEISSSILGDTPIQQVWDRLGARGDLPISAYHIKVKNSIANSYKERPKFVEQVMRGAEKVQHIQTGVIEGLTISAVSLFAQYLPGNSQTESAWFLVDATRTGDRLVAGSAVRMTDSNFAIDSSMTPFDMLSVFLGKYGVYFSLENYFSGKIARDVIVPTKNIKPSFMRDQVAGKVLEYNVTGYERNSQFEGDNFPHSTETKIVLAYAVDITSYRADLLRGIKRRSWK